MTPKALCRKIKTFPASAPITESLERALAGGPANGAYDSQKDHLLGFWGEYETFGYYGRVPNAGRSAQLAYNHFRCAPGLLWLAEAVGVPRAQLLKAKAAVLAVKGHDARQAAALRKVIPWAEIEARL
ncbi:MAG: hypothetical protein QM698_03175 [Micropepsaceae bacterium]